MTYQAIYKCRLCGETYNAAGRIAKTKEDARGIVDSVITAGTHSNGGVFVAFINDKYLHKCTDGSFGIADFQGFKAVEENK